MKKEPIPAGRRPPSRRGSAAAILRKGQAEDYFTPEWRLLGATFLVIVLISSLFTPYTHQLDEIKNVILRMFPPFLLLGAVWMMDFGKMRWKTHASTFFLGMLALSWIVAYIFNPYKAVAERVVWFQMACMTFTVVFAWFMTSEHKMRITMIFFVLLCLWSIIVGYFLFAGQDFTEEIYAYMKKSAFWRGHPEWITLFYTLKESKEMYSWILNVDFYAAFLVMLIPLPLCMFFVEKRLRFKAIAVMTFLFMGIALFLTNSNDSFLAMIVEAVVFIFLGYHYAGLPRTSMKFALVCLAGFLMVAVTAVILGFPEIARSWNFKADAVHGREILWGGGFWPWIYGDNVDKSSVDFVSILFGNGPGGYHSYFPIFRRADFFDNQINNVTTFAHNYYIDLLCETGLFGFIAFMALTGRVLYDGVQQIRFSPHASYRFYQLAILTGLCGIAVQNFFSPNNRWAVCGMIFYAMYGLSMGLHHLENPGERRPTARGEAEPVAPLFARYALFVLAGVFILRSPIQAWDYWWGARYNNDGLRAMEYAEALPSKQKEYLEASQILFERAVTHNPTFVTSYYKLGNVYNQFKRSDDAIATYEKLNGYVPHYSELHLNLGIMYSLKAAEVEGEEQFALMLKAYENIKEAAREELKPNVQNLAGTIGQELASVYDSAGQTDKALELYEEIKQYYRNIINYEPKLPEYKADKKTYYAKAQRLLLTLALVTNKPEEIQPILEKIYWENPDKPEHLDTLISHYDKYNKVRDKIAFLDTASHNDPLDARLHLYLAQAHLQAGDMEKYQNALRRVEILDPKNVSALSQLYLNYKKQGTADKTTAYKEKLIALGVNADELTQPITSLSEPTTASAETTTDALATIISAVAGTTEAELLKALDETETDTARTQPAPATLTTTTPE